MSVFPATTILLIDGDDNDRIHYAQRLKMCSPDYLVLEARDGRSGMELCESQKIDCIVTELDLPDMSAFQLLLDLVPDRQPAVAVVLLAGSFLPAIARLARQHGAQACLRKELTSGDELETVILKSIAAVGSTLKEHRLSIY